jgi:hypothetical protein
MDHMTNSLLGNVKIQDIPSQEARAFRGVGTIGDVEVREVANGYTQIAVPLEYRLSPADTNNRTFVARFNVRREWLTPEYAEKVYAGAINGTELIQYNINVRSLLRGLFTSAGVHEGGLDFDTLHGKLVGFRTKVRRDDPSKLEIGGFFAPRS